MRKLDFKWDGRVRPCIVVGRLNRDGMMLTVPILNEIGLTASVYFENSTREIFNCSYERLLREYPKENR